ncbi:A/G-specific adenine glycosylase [Serratia rubidaea]|uniref:outer membrane assembly protein AsmA n=1 Tax=Serratia rubidaea TaxID=61652 RepID=UPI0007732FDC|nr:outer membrane assembly protein AsmA [Serratia rubidaea]AML59301.1 A/G-specific adenine glycosylase [Serratia rubidaea]
MRRLLTTLVILLVVLVAGMSALVLLVNPNEFRSYMIKRVEQRSGYHLTLEGDLRWHVWPQLSILAGRMTLTAPGAKAPVVSADNMRLDVKLLPLLSHQLFVKQVMLKNAVIRLTPDSEEQSLPDAPIAPGGNNGEESPAASWKFDIDNLQVVDSLLIWQRANNEQINVRDINLSLQRRGDRQAELELASRINRDQRDLSVNLTAELDLSQYPRQASATVSQFSYQLEGADILVGGIKGQGSLQAQYQQTPRRITLNQLQISANDSQFSGSISAGLGDIPDYILNLSSPNLNLDALSGWHNRSGGSDEQPVRAMTAGPVIASGSEQQRDLQALRDFNARLEVSADQLTYRGMNIAQLKLQADNQRGKVTMPTLTGQVAGGDFSLPGSLDVRGDNAVAQVQPSLQRIDLATVFKAFDIPQFMTGQLTMNGALSGDRLAIDALLHSWQGTAQLAVDNAQLHGLNIQQLIQQAVARNERGVRGQDKYQRYTEVQQLTAKANLNRGAVTLRELSAQSPLLHLSGDGTLNLPEKQCDITLNVQVTGGWQGRSELIEQLQKTPIPLRVFGPWQQLNYQLKVDRVLRDSLQDRAKDALNKWAEKNKESRNGQDLKKLLDKL